MRHGRTALLMALTALAGCRRSPKPDAHYEHAARAYQTLFAKELDEAFGDPKMEDVDKELQQVDPDSLDGEAAKAMRASIQHGREELAKARADRQKAQQEVEEQMKRGSNIDPQRVLAASAARDVVPDAGAAPDPYGAGVAVAEINAATGGCLVEDRPFREDGAAGKSGSIYVLSSAPVCAQKLPGFVNQATLVVDGRVYRRISAAEVPAPPPTQHRMRVLPDGGLLPVPDDAGRGPSPAAAPSAEAPDAGEQQ